MANTKIPWESINNSGGTFGFMLVNKKESSWPIAVELNEENANFIIKAVNNHDALVSALEKIRDCPNVCSCCMDEANQALAKVKEAK